MGTTDGMDRAALESDARVERMDRVALLYGEITAATQGIAGILETAAATGRLVVMQPNKTAP